MFGKKHFSIIIAALCLIITLLPAQSPAQDEKMIERFESFSSVSVMKSESGRFMVVGTNRVDGLLLMRWLDEVGDRIERVTALKLPFNNRDFWVNFCGYDDDFKGDVFINQSFVGRTLRQRLWLSSADAAYDKEGREALCRLLLSGYNKSNTGKPLDIPRWLWQGIEQNLTTKVRSKNMTAVLNAWNKGQLVPINELLEESVNVKKEWNKLDIALSGVFIKWISSVIGKEECFTALFKRLAANKPVTEAWLLRKISSSDEETTLDDLWDRWLLKQSNIVHEMGTVTGLLLDQLSSELLLYQGTYGIPLSATVGNPGVMSDLIALKKEPWIAGFVSQKRMRLQLMTAGRGDGYKAVVGKYCDFLTQLGKESRDDVLRKTLMRADAAFAELSAQVKENDGIIRE